MLYQFSLTKGKNYIQHVPGILCYLKTTGLSIPVPHGEKADSAKI